ncbi:glycosyl hydrolase family 8, partial [Enterobacter hormaechei]|uniref:glycosyl hydrolase family 8 n=1 Tax=Enterobacter hormaechei TaxID=158836 RepID=UPI001F0A6F8B
ALLRAQKQWQDKRYAIASDAITAALLKSTVVTFAGRQVMLPGVKGFNLNDHLNLNPSYFIFPALLRAQKQWQDKRYAIASDAITAALLKSTVVT